jgi:hypothetical protein
MLLFVALIRKATTNTIYSVQYKSKMKSKKNSFFLGIILVALEFIDFI